jgi:uncharacterized membrane protein YphA (DoxX/SURF4 family)
MMMWKNTWLWVAQVAVGGLLLFAGWSKVSGAPMMVEMFGLLGLGQWFRYLTGGLELVGAVLLLVPGLAALGAVILLPVMAGAVLTHLLFLGNSPAMPLALFLALASIAWLRRERLTMMLG